MIPLITCKKELSPWDKDKRETFGTQRHSISLPMILTCHQWNSIWSHMWDCEDVHIIVCHVTKYNAIISLSICMRTALSQISRTCHFVNVTSSEFHVKTRMEVCKNPIRISRTDLQPSRRRQDPRFLMQPAPTEKESFEKKSLRGILERWNFIPHLSTYWFAVRPIEEANVPES